MSDLSGSLLLAGAGGAMLFIAVFTLDGATRPGYRPRYHPVSALSLGRRGWLQKANFVVSGGLIALGGVGAFGEIGRLAGLAMAVLGLGLIASGLFTMDAMRGYPPGTPAEDPGAFSQAHLLHDWFGMVVFSGFALVPFITGFALETWAWTIFAWVAAALAAAFAGWFATAWENDAAETGLVQRVTIVVSLGWLAITLVGAV